MGVRLTIRRRTHVQFIEQMFWTSSISEAAAAAQAPQQKGDLGAVDQILDVPHFVRDVDARGVPSSPHPALSQRERELATASLRDAGC